jgi:hypothetical protein
MRGSIQIVAVVVIYGLLHLGCAGSKNGASSGRDGTGAPGMQFIKGVIINEQPILDDRPLNMSAARNETASTVIQLSNLPKPRDKSVLTLRVQPLQLTTANASIDVGQIKAYQILSMPVDANRAGYVRHTGLKAASRTMPRALLPIPMDGGKMNVSALRDPSEPLKPNSRIGLSDEPALIWLDVQVPVKTPPGQYATSVELLRDGQRVESVPLKLNVYDFVLPDDRHLHMVGRIEWLSLETLYPDLFQTITPERINRKEKKYEEAIRLLDQMVALAHENRCDVVVPRLQPVVKWPPNQPPLVDFEDFDTIAEPWLSGAGFADKVPVGYWPLPRIDFLDRYPSQQQMQYWMAAASHFDQKGWMERAWVEVEKETPGRASAQECIELATKANEILDAHPQLRVSLPVEDGQIPFKDPKNPRLIDPQTTDRVMTAGSGLVFAPAARAWPAGVKHPAHWLRTDLPGLVPYVGAGGDERDVRLWAWLAFKTANNSAQVIGWDGALPHSHSAQEAADPNELTWFYPGRWFGVDEMVPTIQLKWLRRAQQDYEYLYLSRQRGQGLYALVMARLMTKPVQTELNQEPDPTHGLLTGTTDPAAWSRALELLAKNILLREPGRERDDAREAELNRDTAMWIAPQDRPFQIARTTTWGWAAKPGNWVDLRLGLDIYNASDQPLTGELQWVNAPRGWEFNPQPLIMGPDAQVNVFQVKRVGMVARVDLSRAGAETRKPLQLKFVDNMLGRPRPSYLTVMAPVAPCDRREGPLAIDGSLGDWSDADDAIQIGPMVMMLDRPSVQKQAMQMASTSSSIYSNWAAKNFYVAFKLDGLAGGEPAVAKNSVEYQIQRKSGEGRAWGEDLCEVLIQPVYVQPGDVGQVVHLVCKPSGQVVLAVKPSPKDQKLFGAGYRNVLGSSVNFQTRAEGSVWRGELEIPWDLINDKNHKGMHSTLMRFNFAQHKHGTGESSSWAGPVDFGQDDSFMGLLYLRDIKTPGMGERQ